MSESEEATEEGPCPKDPWLVFLVVVIVVSSLNEVFLSIRATCPHANIHFTEY